MRMLARPIGLGLAARDLLNVAAGGEAESDGTAEHAHGGAAPTG